MLKPLIEINDLSVQFDNIPLFNRLTFEVFPGDFLSVIGENGVGKTVLLKLILKQLKPKTGSIKVFNKLNIGYVPQFRNIDPEYPLSIRDFVSLNLIDSYTPWLRKNEKQKLEDVLKLTDLLPIANLRLGSASGGQLQRAYLAQALVDQPELLILDESSASLDSQKKYELFDLVSQLNKDRNLTVISVTHDEDLLHRYSNRYLKLSKTDYQFGLIDDLKDEAIKNV